MEKLQRKFEIHKTRCNALIESSNGLIDSSSPERSEVDHSVEQFDKNYSVLSELSDQIIDLLVDVTDDAFTTEKSVELLSYLEEVSRQRRRLINFQQSLLCDTQSEASLARSGSVFPHASSPRLPKLELPKFSGDPMKWHAFWDAFESSVHNNIILSPVEKFNYLNSLLKGPAADATAPISVTNDNYQTAVDLVKERFGKKELIVSSHVDALLRIPQASSTVISLRKVYDLCEIHVGGLRALGIGSEMYGVIVASMILSKLPEEVKLVLTRKNHTAVWNLDDLRVLLREEVENREWVTDSQRISSSKTEKVRQSEPPVTTNLVSGTQPRRTCSFCSSPAHPPWKCDVYSAVSDRLQRAKELKLCFNCLSRGHSSNNCTSRGTCRECNKKHHTALCYGRMQEKQSDIPSAGLSASPKPLIGSTKKSPSVNLKSQTTPTTNASAVLHNSSLILQTATATICNPESGQQKEVRVIFDQGSHRSFIRQSVVEDLALNVGQPETVSVGAFRTKKPTPERFDTTKTSVKRLDGRLQELHAIVVPDVIVSLYRVQVNPELKHCFGEITFADKYFEEDEPVQIDVLIGIDHYWEFVNGDIIRSPHGLIAMKSSVGWLLSGDDISRGKNNSQCDVLLIGATSNSQHQHMDKLWRLDAIGICDQDSPQRDIEEDVMNNFKASIEYGHNRYSVRFPWNGKEDTLPTNYEQSRRRLNSLIQRLRKTGHLEAYNNVIMDQLQRGFIEKVKNPEQSSGTLHYIPHHPVVKADHATTKMRIVYNCSAKANKEALSLNDCLHKGASLVDNLAAILLRFRSHNIAMIADIEKAFLQIQLKAEDRDATRFLWLASFESSAVDKELATFRFCRVLFGASSSPFLLAATLKHHLESSQSSAAKQMLDDFYVDNLLTGCQTTSEAKRFYYESKQIMKDGGMNLREWQSNSTKVLNDIPQHDLMKGSVVGVLGLKWNIESDMLFCKPVSITQLESSVPTKRLALRAAAQIFDPLGFLSPVTIQGKILMQDLWCKNVGWDDPLEEPERIRLQNYLHNFQFLDKVQVPRRYDGISTESGLHVFVDASMKAYSAVAYLVSLTDSDDRSSTFVMSKTRVAPLKELILPKLELMAAYLGAKMASFIQNNVKVKSLHLWSDSQIALAWINSKKPLQQFVRNRVETIKKTFTSFNYCPSAQNVADIPSRGCDIQSLILNEDWLSGPAWMKNPAERPTTPSSNIVHLQAATTIRVPRHSSQQDVSPPYSIDILRHSSLKRLLATTSYCARFVKTSRRQQRFNTIKLDAEELSASKILWEYYVQQDFFDNEFEQLTKQLKRQLRIFTDTNGILRCRSRIEHAATTYDAKNPKFLPKNSPFTTLVIKEVHEKLYHQGERHVVTTLRQKYWIPQIRQTIKTVLRKCVVCKLWEGYPFKIPDNPPLPSLRVTEKPPFSYTGCDFAGPLYYRKSKQQVEKCYICIFTCAVIRAVHLELVHTLAAEDFQLCLRRFISRRGTPIQIVSDNAKTFVLSSQVLDEMWKNLIQDDDVLDYVGKAGIKWPFNVHRAPWWGGFFERMVKSVKVSLKKAIGRSASLSFIQIETLLVEIEAILNTRPLTFVYSQVDSGKSLTPGDFLTPGVYTGIPYNVEDNLDPDYAEVESSSIVLLKKMKRQQQALQRFWLVWKKEYLTSLQEFHRCCNATASSGPKVGDVVLLKEDIPRGQWKKAIVIKLLPGIDGLVRAATVQSADKSYTRPLNLLVPLEVSAITDVSQLSAASPRTTSPPSLSSADCALSDPLDTTKPSRPRRAAASKALSRISDLLRGGHDDEWSPSGPGSV